MICLDLESPHASIGLSVMTRVRFRHVIVPHVRVDSFTHCCFEWAKAMYCKQRPARIL